MKIAGERKIAAAKLAEITGQPAVYTRVPRCAYEVGVFAMDRYGTVTAPESTDLAPLRTLAQEGLLEGTQQPPQRRRTRLQRTPARLQSASRLSGTTQTAYVIL